MTVIKTVLLSCCFSSVVILSSCSTEPSVVKPRARPSLDGTPPLQTVYATNHGWHTGIVVSANKIVAEIDGLRGRFENAAYLEFGWGDKDFYQAEEMTSGLAARAILWPTEAVLHVVSLPERPDRYFPNSEVVEIPVSEEEYTSLGKFIASSFASSQAGGIVPLGAGIYGDSRFYRATGRYHLTNTCNTWTAKALKSAGMDISASSKLTAGSVMDYLRSNSKAQSTGSRLKTRSAPAVRR